MEDSSAAASIVVMVLVMILFQLSKVLMSLPKQPSECDGGCGHTNVWDPLLHSWTGEAFLQISRHTPDVKTEIFLFKCRQILNEWRSQDQTRLRSQHQTDRNMNDNSQSTSSPFTIYIKQLALKARQRQNPKSKQR